jgi:hypothetical protein
VTIDKGAFVNTARLDIAAGLPEIDPATKCVLQMASGETLPILKEALVTSTAVPTNNLSVHRQYHHSVHPGTRRHTCPLCICELQAP